MPRFLPVGKDAQGAARFLLAALPALGALLTALAITGDLVGRMARNHPVASFAAFGCAALAVFLGAVAAFGLREDSPEERRILYVGLVVLGAGLVFTVYAGVKTWGDRPQPSITVTPKRGSIVAVSVRGIGLRSSDHLVVEVEQLLRVTDRRGRLSWRPGQPLYGASLGPDNSGEIEQTVDLPLPAGDFDDLGARAWVGDAPRHCYANGNTTGCVRVHICARERSPSCSRARNSASAHRPPTPAHRGRRSRRPEGGGRLSARSLRSCPARARRRRAVAPASTKGGPADRSLAAAAPPRRPGGRSRAGRFPGPRRRRWIRVSA